MAAGFLGLGATQSESGWCLGGFPAWFSPSAVAITWVEHLGGGLRLPAAHRPAFEFSKGSTMICLT